LKTKHYLNLIISLFLYVSIPLESYSQSDKTIDITKKEIKFHLKESKKCKESKFIQFALTKFLHGTKIDFEKLKSRKNNFVGVGKNFTNYKTDTLNNTKLYGLSYLGKGKGDFHRNLYFDDYGNFFGKFFVIPYTENQTTLINEAVKSLVESDSLPKSNEAYQYALSHKIEQAKFYKLYETNDSSFIQIGNPNIYFRKNGNFIIEINLKNNYTDSKSKKQTASENAISLIAIYLIDENAKKNL
jgi:hypothetical protein